MRQSLCAIFVLLIASGVNAQVELKPTPIQSQFESILYSAIGSDDFLTPVDQVERVGKHSSEKSVFKAAAYSLLLPGLGEYYVGNRAKANYFFGVEAMTWVTFISLRIYGGWKEDDYIRFAAEHAGAQLENKDDEFRNLLSQYEDIDQYNTLGRALEPSSPYYEDNAENHWMWQSTDDRVAYRILRESSRDAYKRADWVVLTSLLTRVVSVIDAVRDAKRYQSLEARAKLTKSRTFKFSMNPLSTRTQIKLTYYPGG